MVEIRITDLGLQSIWNWVLEHAREPAAHTQAAWTKEAHMCVMLAEGQFPKVCMPGRQTQSGHLVALNIKPEWFSYYRQPSMELPSLGYR